MAQTLKLRIGPGLLTAYGVGVMVRAVPLATLGGSEQPLARISSFTGGAA